MSAWWAPVPAHWVSAQSFPFRDRFPRHLQSLGGLREAVSAAGTLPVMTRTAAGLWLAIDACTAGARLLRAQHVLIAWMTRPGSLSARPVTCEAIPTTDRNDRQPAAGQPPADRRPTAGQEPVVPFHRTKRQLRPLSLAHSCTETIIISTLLFLDTLLSFGLRINT
jgi:hypothetical protein